MNAQEWQGVFGQQQTPSIDDMKQLISMYIYQKKGMQINIQLREDQMQGDLDKLEKAYSIALNNFMRG